MKTKVNFALLAGCCGAAASLFGKLSGLPELQELYIVRILCFGLMLICNGLVWTLFVKALHDSKSSLTATVLSSASNYTLSGIIGLVIFGEVTTLKWWSGIAFIICGLLLVCKDQNEHNKTK